MALDLEAIKRKVAELSGNRKTSNIQLWKPGPGEYRIRVLPWKDGDASNPFKELWFYYLGDQPSILSPSSMNKPDPINDLMKSMYATKKPEDREIANRLRPKMRAYAPIVVRGQEDLGVQVWSFGKIVYQRLLSFFVDEDYGDITNTNDGYDLKVVISKVPGKQFNDTTIDVKGRPCKLSDDAALVTKWSETPNLFDMYKLKSTEEIKMHLNAYLYGGEAVSEKPETSRGVSKSDDLEKIASEIKAEKKKPKPVAPPADDDEETNTASQSLDDAFKELMSDD